MPEPDYAVISHRSERGIPIGREAAVALTNNHLQYIFTWCVLGSVSLFGPYSDTRARYALGLATSYMFWLVVRKPPTSISRRVRMSSEWANR